MSKTHIAFVLDMSGSMGTIEEATKEGTAQYIKTLKKDSPESRFNLTIFDTVFEKWIVDTPMSEIKPNKAIENYKPRGMTALMDAVGKTVSEMEPKVTKDDKAVVVVMTDGQENSSKEFTREQIFKLVKKLEKKGNWTFVYLGANVDAYAEAQKYGILAGNVASYSSTARSASSVMGATAKATGMHVNSTNISSRSVFSDAGEDVDHREEEEKKSDAKSPTASH